jgi:cytochrome c-type biogenesis protein CcmF
MIWRRRGFNKLWSIFFIIVAFLLTIFGAFLTRSDLLSSVHTFGATPAEPIFLVFMALALIGTLIVVVIRWRDLKDAPGENALISGETTFFVNSLLITLATIAVFVGTMFPFFSRIFTGTTIEQDADFFNSTAVPIFLALILLSGLGVLVGFNKPKLSRLGRSLIWPTTGALVIVLVMLAFGLVQWYVLATSFILAFTLFATITKWVIDITQYCAGKKIGFFRAFHRLFSANRARYGGYIVHIAIVIIAVGVMGSSAYAVRLNDVVLSPGQSIKAQAYTLTYNDFSTSNTTGTTMTITANFDLWREGKHLGKLQPSLKYYGMADRFTFEAAVRSTLADDVYVSIYDFNVSSQSIGASILVNPLVMWIWIGSAILFLGGLWAFSAPAKKTEDDKDN